MLKWALVFAVVALVAGGLGFGGAVGEVAAAGKVLFVVFAGGFVVLLAIGLMSGRRPTG